MGNGWAWLTDSVLCPLVGFDVRSILLARGCTIFTVLFGLYLYVYFCHVSANSVELVGFCKCCHITLEYKKMHWLCLGIILYHHSALKYIRQYIAVLKCSKVRMQLQQQNTERPLSDCLCYNCVFTFLQQCIIRSRLYTD